MPLPACAVRLWPGTPVGMFIHPFADIQCPKYTGLIDQKAPKQNFNEILILSKIVYFFQAKNNIYYIYYCH